MKRLFIMLVILLTISGCAPSKESVETKQEPMKGEVTVHYIDVGQGDATFIVAPNGKTLLIDGGKKSAGEKVTSYIKDLGYETIDYVVATHPDADHIGGLLDVLDTFHIGTFYDSGKVHTTQTYYEMLERIEQNNVAFIIPKTGETIPLDPSFPIEVKHANPEAKGTNEASIVIYAEYGDVTFLFTGDADREMERSLLSTLHHVTILKAGHHGSNTSSDPQFIQHVQPEVAIVSYGQRNKYGHPHKEVIQQFQQHDIQTYETAPLGDIVVKTDGQTYDVAHEKTSSVIVTEKENKMNVNEATEEELQTLKGIGPVLAEEIVKARERQLFTSIEEVKEVWGIGDKTYEQIKDDITVE